MTRPLFEFADVTNLYPSYLSGPDCPLIENILEVYLRAVGKPQIELERLLRERDFSSNDPNTAIKIGLIQKFLNKEFIPKLASLNPSPSQLRLCAFRIGHMKRADLSDPNFRIKTLTAVAKSFNVSLKIVESNLYADLQNQGIVTAPKNSLETAQIANCCNKLMVEQFLLKSEGVVIKVRGKILPLIRHVKLRGLICEVFEMQENGPYLTLLKISGPLSILQKTNLYGKYLGELVGYLPLLESFILKAMVTVGDTQKVLNIKNNDPIFTSTSSKKFDSKLEEKFYRQFQKATSDWDLVREPVALKAGNSYVFPDFVIIHRRVKALVWYLEIVGFWTPEYISNKMKNYRLVEAHHVIFCIGEKHWIEGQGFPENIRVITFKSRIAVETVLDIIDSRQDGQNTG